MTFPLCAWRVGAEDKGVDYGCNGFMFDVVVGKRPIVITGMQICSAHGTPFDYKVLVVHQQPAPSFQASMSHPRSDSMQRTPCNPHTQTRFPSRDIFAPCLLPTRRP